MSSTQQEAERCAASAPVGMFGIDDVLILGQVIYLGFKFWQACSAPNDGASAVSNAFEANQWPSSFRRAQKRVRRAAIKHGQWLSDSQLTALTDHMLKHVSQTSSETLGVCCSEPIQPDEEFDD